MCETKTLWSVALDWLPLIIIMGVWVIYGAFWQWKTNNLGRDGIDSNNKLFESNHELIAELREMKEILKDRK